MLDDLPLVLLRDLYLVVLVLLEIDRYHVQERLEHRRLVPVELLDGAQDTVQRDAVTCGDHSGYVVLDVTGEPLGLGTSPEALRPLLDLDLLRICERG